MARIDKPEEAPIQVPVPVKEPVVVPSEPVKVPERV